jgi:MFS family permease
MDASAAQARRIAQGRWIDRIGRFGLLAQGVSYVLVGALAIMLAVGLGGETASRQGALATLGDEPGGAVVLLLLACGFAGYAIWRLAQAIFDRGDEGDDASGLAKRAGQLGKAAIYIGLTWAAVGIVVRGHGGSGNEEKEATGGVFDWPAGRWIVSAVAVAILAVAAYQVYRAVSRSFMDELEEYKLTKRSKRWIAGVGFVGILGRGVIFALVGAFLVKAVVEFDPDEAIGLDGALRKTAEAPYGSALLAATAAGLVVFGVFCLLQAYYRDV